MSARRSNGHGQDSLDALSSACYTIPWQPNKKSKTSSNQADPRPDSCFPVLAEHETDNSPAHTRYSSYNTAIHRIDTLFDACIERAFAALFQNLRTFFHAGPEQEDEVPPTSLDIADTDFYLPGCQTDAYAQKRSSSIQTALLISSSAPWLSSFSSRLVAQIAHGGSQENTQSVIVTLGSSECTNLHTALRLLVARFIAQARLLVTHDVPQDARLTAIELAAVSGKIEPDLHLLGRWWAARFGHLPDGPSVVLNLSAIETVEPTVLSDLLSALQAFVSEALNDDEGDRATIPSFVLILGITSPSGGLQSAKGASSTAAPAPWIDYIPRKVLRVLDISRFALPSKEAVWSQLVQSFLVSRHLPLSLGPATFEFVRQTYWEKDADLDSVLDAVHLACFLHFSGKPEAVFAISGQASQLHTSSWTPLMMNQLQTSFIAANDASGNLVFPLLASNSEDERFELDAFMHRITTSTEFLMQNVDQLAHTRQVLSFRVELAVRFLHRAFESLQRIQSKAASAAQAIQARNTSSSAVAAAAAAAQQALEVEEQRQIERGSEILTQIVSQCLIASVGSVDRPNPAPNALLLSSGLAKLSNAARRLLSDEFEELLDDLVALAEEEVSSLQKSLNQDADDLTRRNGTHLRTAPQIMLVQSEDFLAALRTFQQKLAQTIALGSANLDDEDMIESPHPSANSNAGGAVQQRREARLQRVQRKLLMEEKLLGLKREITDWIVHFISDLVDWKLLGPSGNAGPLRLLKNIFWVDSYDPLSTLLDPSPRAGLTLPLTEPLEFLESLYDAALSVVPLDAMPAIDLTALQQSAGTPDVGRIYQLYRECGKFVNLADWFDAFKQSVELDNIFRANDGEFEQGGNDEAAQASAVSDDVQLGLTAADDDEDEFASAGEESGGSNDDHRVDASLLRTPTRRNHGHPQRNKSSSSRKRLASPSDSDTADEDGGDGSDDVQYTPSKRPKRQSIAPALPPRTPTRGSTASSDVQARFALALNELARMGMLRGTRRRAEHITKVMWDLVPDTI